jgi:ATP-dependent DNA helicase RecG
MEGLEHVMDYFSEYNVTMLHGKMKPDEKDAAMAILLPERLKLW